MVFTHHKTRVILWTKFGVGGLSREEDRIILGNNQQKPLGHMTLIGNSIRVYNLLMKKTQIEPIKKSEFGFKTALDAGNSILKLTDKWLYFTVPYHCSWIGEGQTGVSHLKAGIFFVRPVGANRWAIYRQTTKNKKTKVELVGELYTI